MTYLDRLPRKQRRALLAAKARKPDDAAWSWLDAAAARVQHADVEARLRHLFGTEKP